MARANVVVTSNVGLALAGLTAWGLYGYMFSRDAHPSTRQSPRRPAQPTDRELCIVVHGALHESGVVSNPGAVHVRAKNGYVTLSGDVVGSETLAVMSVVRALPRVKGVRNRLGGRR